jgi:hypothetical protein
MHRPPPSPQRATRRLRFRRARDARQWLSALSSCCAFLGTSGAAYAADGGASRDEAEAPYRLELRADAGFLAVLAHDYQKGSAGSTFDFADEGGQDVLFAVRRFTASLELGRRHRV